jgi:hypothetical protein
MSGTAVGGLVGRLVAAPVADVAGSRVAGLVVGLYTPFFSVGSSLFGWLGGLA